MRPTAIHLAQLDLAADGREAFDAFLRERHLPALLRRPGWLRAHVLTCTDGSPDRLVLHELEALPEPAARLAAAPLADPAAAAVRDYRAETWRATGAFGAIDPHPRLLNVIATEVEPSHAAAFDAWYRDVHVPEVRACPGWGGALRFASADAPGRFLALYEVDNERRPFGTSAYRAADGWDGHEAHLTGFHGYRLYRRCWTVERPEHDGGER